MTTAKSYIDDGHGLIAKHNDDGDCVFDFVHSYCILIDK